MTKPLRTASIHSSITQASTRPPRQHNHQPGHRTQKLPSSPRLALHALFTRRVRIRSETHPRAQPGQKPDKQPVLRRLQPTERTPAPVPPPQEIVESFNHAETAYDDTIAVEESERQPEPKALRSSIEDRPINPNDPVPVQERPIQPRMRALEEENLRLRSRVIDLMSNFSGDGASHQSITNHDLAMKIHMYPDHPSYDPSAHDRYDSSADQQARPGESPQLQEAHQVHAVQAVQAVQDARNGNEAHDPQQAQPVRSLDNDTSAPLLRDDELDRLRNEAHQLRETLAQVGQENDRLCASMGDLRMRGVERVRELEEEREELEERLTAARDTCQQLESTLCQFREWSVQTLKQKEEASQAIRRDYAESQTEIERLNQVMFKLRREAQIQKENNREAPHVDSRMYKHVVLSRDGMHHAKVIDSKDTMAMMDDMSPEIDVVDDVDSMDLAKVRKSLEEGVGNTASKSVDIVDMMDPKFKNDKQEGEVDSAYSSIDFRNDDNDSDIWTASSDVIEKSVFGRGGKRHVDVRNHNAGNMKMREMDYQTRREPKLGYKRNNDDMQEESISMDLRPDDEKGYPDVGVEIPHDRQTDTSEMMNPLMNIGREPIIVGHFCRHAVETARKILVGRVDAIMKEEELKRLIQVEWGKWVDRSGSKQDLVTKVDEWVRRCCREGGAVNVVDSFNSWYGRQYVMYRERKAAGAAVLAANALSNLSKKPCDGGVVGAGRHDVGTDQAAPGETPFIGGEEEEKKEGEEEVKEEVEEEETVETEVKEEVEEERQREYGDDDDDEVGEDMVEDVDMNVKVGLGNKKNDMVANLDDEEEDDFLPVIPGVGVVTHVFDEEREDEIV